MKKGCQNCVYNEKISKNFFCGNKKRNDTHVLEKGICNQYEKKRIKYRNLPEINKYILNERININTLLKDGFKIVEKEDNSRKLVFQRRLTGKIDVLINIIIDDNSLLFDESENIYIIDRESRQLYYPFYTCQIGFPLLNEVIIKYNEFMDSLIEEGILVKQSNKVLTKKRYGY